MIFSKCKIQDYPAFLFGHKIIQVVDDYGYLSIKFNSNGSFNKAISKKVLQGKNHSIPYWIKFLSCKHYQLIFHWNCLISWCCQFCYMDVKYEDLVILPKLTFCIKIYIKILLGLANFTVVYGETGNIQIMNHVKSRMINLYMRLMNGKLSKLAFTMYILMRKKCDLENDYNPKWLNICGLCMVMDLLQIMLIWLSTVDWKISIVNNGMKTSRNITFIIL